MTSQNKVAQLRQLIYKSLTSLVDNDYLLLDLPYHSNLGDTLIWQGELDFLKILPYKCKYSTWLGGNILMAGRFLRPETIILFQGGGNFGDVWNEPQEFRKNVLKLYPHQRAIVLPQTVFYNDKRKMLEDAEFFSNYPNVTICARDMNSLELLQKHFPNNRSLLVPDMAFYMNVQKNKRAKRTNGSLFVKREDRELKNVTYAMVPQNAQVSDWTFLGKSKRYAHQQVIRKWGSRFDRILRTDFEHKWIDWYWQHVLRSLNIRTAIDFLDRYEHIYTTRMHAAILGVILSKTDVTLFDNSYGKSSSFYHTWLEDVDGLRLM